jgi:hypothetical protein
MATLSSTYLNLIDMHKQNDPRTGEIIEVLKQQNPILDDAVAMECNMGAIHRHGIRTGLPTPAWGRLYQGIPQSKSSIQQVDDTTGFLEARSGVDTRLLKLSKNPAALRLGEAMSHLEAMNQEMATGLFYHDTASTPEKFKGLSARFGIKGGAGAGNQIIDAGGSGSDNTSIWFVTWGDHACHLLYPEGTKAGIQRDDKGEQRVTDANGDPYYVKEETFEWHMGMAVKDWRYVVRIANVDVSDMIAGNVDIYNFMRKAYWKLQSRRLDAKSSRIAIYCNRDVLEALDAMQVGGPTSGTAENAYLRLTPKELEGKEVLTYRNFPLRETDALLNTEARVV